MKLGIFLTLLCCIPGIAGAATRGDATVRVGVNRMSQAGVHSANMSVNLGGGASASNSMPTLNINPGISGSTSGNTGGNTDTTPGASGDVTTEPPAQNSQTCREAYRACMDEFCLLDESEGSRCACSSNINQSKSLIQEIQEIQEEADLLYTEGVEREQMGAQARLVFGESEEAQKSSRISGISFADWINSGTDEEDVSLGSDSDIGDPLYAMASEYCASRLEACGDDAEMEEMLYARMVVQDCKTFESYLQDQKSIAESNKRTAEAAVRQARLQMLDTTRANACENVLDQCMAVREYVLADWEDEAVSILADAAKYADRNARATCLARIQLCLEDGCSTETNSACLTDVNVAAGVCPVIDECEEMIPGIKAVVNDKLGYLRTQFCQNDVDACLRDRRICSHRATTKRSLILLFRLQCCKWIIRCCRDA